MTESDEKLAQPEASMFERNVGHMASRGREAKVVVRGLPDPVIGFFAGLDDQYVQMCITKTQGLAEINRSDVIMVEETGHTLSDYDRIATGSSTDIDEEFVRRIRKRIEHFQKKSAHVFRK